LLVKRRFNQVLRAAEGQARHLQRPGFGQKNMPVTIDDARHALGNAAP